MDCDNGDIMKAIDLETQSIICGLYLDGATGVEIAKTLQKDNKTVYKILKKYGITKTPSQARQTYSANEQYFDNIETARQAYWLGFLSGDGGVAKNKLILNLSIKDKIILEQFNKDVQSNNIIHQYGKFVNLTITSDTIVKSLQQHNIVPNKTKLFTLSDKIPTHLLGKYILGLNDADGCFSVDKKRGLRMSMLGTTEAMKQVQNILIEQCGVNKNKLQNHHSTPYIKYLVYSGNRQLAKIIDFLYRDSDFHLPRKYEIVKKYFDLK